MLGGTTHLLLDEVERVKPARMALDSLAELRLISQNPLRYRRQILALKQFFQNRSATDMWQVSEDDSLRAANLAFSHRSCGTFAV